jgi:hypothetical protein
LVNSSGSEHVLTRDMFELMIDQKFKTKLRNLFRRKSFNVRRNSKAEPQRE